jgi:hypothetical protein
MHAAISRPKRSAAFLESFVRARVANILAGEYKFDDADPMWVKALALFVAEELRRMR